MTKNRDEPENDDDIMPPETGNADAQRGTTGARQLPPLIDQIEGGVVHHYITRPILALVALMRLLLRRLLRLGFWSAVTLLIIYVGLLFWQINRPAGDWAKGERDWLALLRLNDVQILLGLQSATSTAAISDNADAAPLTDEAALSPPAEPSENPAVATPELAAELETESEPALDAQNQAAAAGTDEIDDDEIDDKALQAEQAAHAETKAALLTANQTLDQLRAHLKSRRTEESHNRARAMIAELILRLENKASIAPLLADLQADGLLTASEIAALEAYGDAGVIGADKINASYQRFKGQLSLSDTIPAAAPTRDTPPQALSWLHEWSRGTLSLTRLPDGPPPVASDATLAALESALAAQQHQTALAVLQRIEILALMPQDEPARTQAIDSRQELLEHLTAAADHEAWLGLLKQDFLLGRRP